MAHRATAARAVAATAKVPRRATAAKAVAATAKVPHWVPAGFEHRLRGRGVRGVDLYDAKLAVYRTAGDELRVVRDACPHRGASLRCGGKVAGECVVCPYHSRAIGERTHPDRFFRHAVQDGVVWVDASPFTPRTAPDADAPPPRYPEHADPGLRTISYTKWLRVNPVLMAENTLDWQHLASVHRVHFIKGVPEVTVHATGAHGLAQYAYRSDLFDLTIDNEYHAPFTTSLRFRFSRRDTGEALPPLLLWFSLAPAGDRTALHLRVSRGVLKTPLADWLFKLIDELPLLEDAAVVGGVDPMEWSRNRLGPGDEFVAAYREAMREYPELLERYVY